MDNDRKTEKKDNGDRNYVYKENIEQNKKTNKN